jgi:hypothetical protein
VSTDKEAKPADDGSDNVEKTNDEPEKKPAASG